MELSAEPTAVAAGEPVQLTWTTFGTEHCFLNHAVGEVPLEGSREVYPFESTSFVLTCRTATGVMAEADVSLDVAPADPLAHILGTVVDAATEEPLEGAEVFVHNGINVTTSTDAQGHFDLTINRRGTYFVELTKAGFTQAGQQLEVLPGHVHNLQEIRLTPVDPKVTHVVASQGATVTNSDDSVILEIPPGAIQEDADIRITRQKKLEDMPVPQPGNTVFLFSAVFDSPGIAFNQPVPLKIKIAPNFLIPAGTALPWPPCRHPQGGDEQPARCCCQGVRRNGSDRPPLRCSGS